MADNPESSRFAWTPILTKLTTEQALTRDEARAVIGEILAGNATDAQIAGAIVALRMRGESIEELVGFREGMLEAATPLSLPENSVDIVGMGGSKRRQKSAFNVSTIACFVAAGAGVVVCKHGNRRASSTSGSFDLLEALGVQIDIDADQLARAVADIGVGFAYARTFHPAMRHVAAVRAELGVPSVFNVLGPVSHPGRVLHQVLGVADPLLAPRIAELLAATGARYSLVVTGHENSDELTITGPSQVIEVRNATTRSFSLDAATYGMAPVPVDAVAGGDADRNAMLAQAILRGDERGPHRDVVVLNAAAATVVSGVCGDFASGIEACQAAIDSGRAHQVLHDYVAFTNATTEDSGDRSA